MCLILLVKIYIEIKFYYYLIFQLLIIAIGRGSSSRFLQKGNDDGRQECRRYSGYYEDFAH